MNRNSISSPSQGMSVVERYLRDNIFPEDVRGNILSKVIIWESGNCIIHQIQIGQ